MKIDIEKIKAGKKTKELLEFGIINIDKSSGPTSFDTSEFVMKALKLRKTSHFGTLDPKVTGALPVALNRACKLTGFFLGEDKEYVGLMHIHEPISEAELKKGIKAFTGKIMQLPPVKSRVKRAIREREIKRFEILEMEGQEVLFRVECQGGTYIRKLIHDLGESLKVGAHMLELRRVRAGIFKEDDEEYPVVNLYDLEKAVNDEQLLRKIIIPGEVVSRLFPVVEIKEESTERILRGQPIYKKNLVKGEKFSTNDKICVFSGMRFVGVYRVINDGETFAKAEFVLQPI